MKKLIISITLLLIATPLISAEIIPVWHKINQDGSWIHDIEFLRGEDEFIMLAGVQEKGAIQIRETLTGEIISSFPLSTLSYHNQIEITPDSNRFVITTGGDKINKPTIELRNISDFSLAKRLTIQMDKDSLDVHKQRLYYIFNDVIIDPVRPYIYAFLTKTNFYTDDVPDSTRLKVYNYETMEEVDDLTPVGYEVEFPKCMDISDDGRYLATLNSGKAYLKVWDLSTMELIKNKRLYDEPFDPSKSRCEVNDIEFSSIDDDLIYFSGYLPGIEKPAYPGGVFKYYISNNSYKKIELNRDYSNGRLILFDNEARILSYAGFSLYFLNQQEKKVELMIVPTLEYPLDQKTIFAKKHRLFIGFSIYTIGSIKYDGQTAVETYTKEITISPNPTGSFVNVGLECADPQINYQISDINGLLISEGSAESHSGSLQIDFSPYPAGIYFLTINCGDSPLTYKVIRE